MKVFLKYNRNDPSANVCLNYWLELFDGYEIIINCDLFQVNKDPVLASLERLTYKRQVKFINSDYSLGNTYTSYMKSRKRCMASANLTCWQYLDKKDKFFWVIDADDTMFLHQDIRLTREKISSAEKYADSNDLDGFSLDFYREYNDTWTFGVCLMKASVPWQRVKEVTPEDLSFYNLPINCDSSFDVLGKKSVLKLKNFIFERFSFQHLINNHPGLANGLYYWQDRKLWNTELKDDVVIL